MANFTWADGASADWTTTLDWGGIAYPDDAVANALVSGTGSETITIAAGESIVLDSLSLDTPSAVVAVQGTLAPAGSLALLTLKAGTLSIAGTLLGGTVRQAGGTLAMDDGTLDAVTVLGTFDLGDARLIPVVGGYEQSTTAYVRGGLTAATLSGATPGALDVHAGTLAFLDSETLDNAAVGVGSADFPVAGVITEALAGGTLTFGAGLVVTTIGAAEFTGAAGSRIVNRGSIVAGFNQAMDTGSLAVAPDFTNAGTFSIGAGSTSDSNGQEIVSFAAGFSNTGSVTVADRGRLVLLSTSGFTNTGTISLAAGGTLEIDGNFSLAQLNAMAAAFPHVLGTVDTVGTWNLDGGTLDVASLGNVALNGTVENGTIKANAGFTTAGTLDGVSVLGTLRGAAGVEGGLTVTAVGPVGGGSIDLSADSLTFLDSETIDNVAILLGDHTLREADVAGTLTLGPAVVVTVAGTGSALIDGTSAFGSIGGTIVNQGLIDANSHALTISPEHFINAGTLSAGSGGSVTFSGAGDPGSDAVTNLGTMIGVSASFSFDDTDPFTNEGTLLAEAGTVLLNAVVVVQNPTTHAFMSISDMTNLPGTILTGGSFIADAGATLNLVVAGSISVDDAYIALNGVGAELVATRSLEATLTSIDVAGTLAVLGNRNYSSTLAMTDSGLLQLAGGRLSTAGLTLTSGGTLQGFGTLAAAPANAGTIEAKGGRLALASASGAGLLEVDAQATLELTAAGTAEITFNGVGGTVLLDAPAAYTGTLDGFGPNDTLVLQGVTADSATIDGDALLVTLAAGGTLSFALADTLANLGPTVSEVGGNAEITLAGTLPPPVPSWLNPMDGDWSVGADWDTGTAPNSITAEPTIAVAGSYTVGIAAGETIAVDTLLLNQAGATLAVSGTLLPAGTLNLQAGTLSLDGTIKGGSLLPDGGTLALEGGTLDGVTVLGTLDLAANAGTAFIRDGLTARTAGGGLPGSIALGGGTLALLDSTALTGMAIGIGTGGSLEGATGGTISLASGASVSATGNAGISATDLVNAGLIGLAAATLSIDATNAFTNTGTISGSGTLQLPDAAIDDVGLLRAAGGTLVVLQTGSLGFDALTNYSPAVLRGGSYAATAGATLDLQLGGNIATDGAALTLDGAGSVIQTFFGSYHALETTLTSIDTAGTLALFDGRGYATTETLTDTGVLELAGGSFVAGALSLSAGGRFLGFGTISADLANAGTIEAQGGDLKLSELTGAGLLQVDSGGTLELATATDEDTSFHFPGGILRLDTAADYTGTLIDFAPQDTLLLHDESVTTARIAGDTLLVTLEAGGTLDYSLSDLQRNIGVTVTVDPSGGTDIGLEASPDSSCFAGGTRLLTSRGEVAVEALAVGDTVPTLLGRGLARIRWIGHRRVDWRRHERPDNLRPIRVKAGAFAAGVPLRDLVLSPDHSVFIAAPGVLIPIRYLVNGVTVLPADLPVVTYWHVELAAHDVLLAEGLPAESYLDTGNRGAFANGGAVTALHPDFALSIWQLQGCARLAVSGPALVAARRHLRARAETLGHVVTADPALRLLVGGVPCLPEISGADHRFRLPQGAGVARLLSRVMVPAEMLPEATDPRRLGVAVAALRLDGRPVAPDDPRLGGGWHDGEAGWRWTDGEASLDCTGAAELEVTLLDLPRYWVGSEVSLDLSGSA